MYVENIHWVGITSIYYKYLYKALITSIQFSTVKIFEYYYFSYLIFSRRSPIWICFGKMIFSIARTLGSFYPENQHVSLDEGMKIKW